MSTGISRFQQLDHWVFETCANSADALTREMPENLLRFQNSQLRLADEYGFRFHPVDEFLAFGKKILASQGLNEYHKYYWTDFARNVDAYRVITNWRLSELTESCIRALGFREYVSAGVLARSALELSAVFFDNSTFFWFNLEKVIEAIRTRHPDEAILSEDLELFALRITWGTRINNPPAHLTQTNAYGAIKRVSRHPGHHDLQEKYEFLCEVAHPNVVGNKCFFEQLIQLNDDGSQSIKLNRYAYTEGAKNLMGQTLWAISWACKQASQADELIKERSQALLQTINVADRKHRT